MESWTYGLKLISNIGKFCYQTLIWFKNESHLTPLEMYFWIQNLIFKELFEQMKNSIYSL